MILEELVAKVKGGGTLETARLASELGTSVELIEAMLEHLQRQGIIESFVRCSDGCRGCDLNMHCANAAWLPRLWQANEQ